MRDKTENPGEKEKCASALLSTPLRQLNGVNKLYGSYTWLAWESGSRRAEVRSENGRRRPRNGRGRHLESGAKIKEEVSLVHGRTRSRVLRGRWSYG